MWLCKKCKKYRYSPADKCNCEPFTVINEEGDEYTVHAVDEKLAALAYAERSNMDDEYYLMNESVVITVNDKEFEISAEPDVHYSANEI